MKKTNIVKSRGDLPAVTVQVAEATPATIAESLPPAAAPGEDIREWLRLRATTPLRIVIPYHRWGLNE